MLESHLSRVLSINFISALIISLVGCYFLKTINLTNVMHIANLLGLSFLVIFGINILVESGDIRNGSQRFLVAIALILIFDLVFLFIVPFFFEDVLSVTDSFVFAFNGARVNLHLNVYVYLAIYAIVMLVFNLSLYLRDRGMYSYE
ncbi:hypothetical protein [Methanobrevibacter sp.]|uniref:hypothetical protein n=1 Tax=Methanobrevibacter sp. TaxID=66852 RepID=UPI003864C0F9